MLSLRLCAKSRLNREGRNDEPSRVRAGACSDVMMRRWGVGGRCYLVVVPYEIRPAVFDAVAVGFSGYLDAGGIECHGKGLSFDVDLTLQRLFQRCHENLQAVIGNASWLRALIECCY